MAHPLIFLAMISTPFVGVLAYAYWELTRPTMWTYWVALEPKRRRHYSLPVRILCYVLSPIATALILIYL